ncbi:hypothetical protein J1605_019199 [Eschrichtius robustus]|uniref:Uncharacterized protein n=1 Tax=Eschrichtius robustus TaxID=9764 RepID=A0AB34HNF8_ESCRO|nr:hypothetical protein J1605_019199 [Eschrichtius robustus]
MSEGWLQFEVHLRSARRLCELCCANRGTFIKVGQHLGALDYLLPEEYTRTLKVLHSQAPQSSMQEVRQVIREDLGKEVPTSARGGLDLPPQTFLIFIHPREQQRKGLRALPYTALVTLLWTHASDLQDVQIGLALRGIPSMGDEGEVAALLDPMIYTWFWISPHPWTAASAVSAELEFSEKGTELEAVAAAKMRKTSFWPL